MDDTELPRALIKRIAKASLTHQQASEGKTDIKDIQLSKDAILALAESARVFINYLTATGKLTIATCQSANWKLGSLSCKASEGNASVLRDMSFQ